MDLAEGHVSALQYVEAKSAGEHTYSVFNLGSGVGYSVLDMVEAMKVASGRALPYEFAPRRAGDIAVCYADTKKASEVLGWTAKRQLADMCKGKIYFLFYSSQSFYFVDVIETESTQLMIKNEIEFYSNLFTV